MLKKIIYALLALMLAFTASVGLAGCGDKQPRANPNEEIDWSKFDWEGNKDSTTEIKVVFSQHFESYYLGLINEFKTAHPEYTINATFAPAGDGVIMMQDNMIGAKDAPDVIMGGDVHIASQWELLMPLDKLVERDAGEVDPDDFIPELMNAVTYGKGLYYLPEYFNVSLLYYNKTMFSNESLALPTSDWTYDEYFAAGKQLTKKTGDKYTQWGSEIQHGWWGQWLTYVRQFGGDIMNKDFKVTLDSQDAIAALQKYIDTTGVTQKPETFENKIGPGPSDDNLGNFEGGKTAMVFGGHTGNFEAFNKQPLLNWDIELLPIGPAGREGGEIAVNGFGIFKSSKNVKGAWELVKFLTRKRDAAMLQKFSYPAPRLSEMDLLLGIPKEQRKNPKNIEALYDAIQYSRTLPRVEYFTDVLMNRIQPYIVLMQEGSISVEDGVKQATNDANNYIDMTYNY